MTSTFSCDIPAQYLANPAARRLRKRPPASRTIPGRRGPIGEFVALCATKTPVDRGAPTVTVRGVTVTVIHGVEKVAEVSERLVRAGAAQDDRNRLEEDPDVAGQGNVLHVVELDREPLAEVEVAPAVDLHRPRHARLHVEPEAVFGTVALDQLDLLRPRPDHAHVATQD